MGSTPQEYWGALIDPERMSPTPRLEALLSGIAHYIIKNLEPREHHVLTPDKLANFYRSVGGNFDKLFLESSPASLSFVYQALGCYHSLQPASDPFKPPAIPALTVSGFKRWHTIQLLLQPSEQVPLLQDAVRRYDIVNKTDGHVFPKILPVECFPRDPNPGMVKWHDESLQKLKREAEAESAARNAPPAPRPAMAQDYSGTPSEDYSSGPEDENSGYFSIARLRKGVASRWDAFRGEGRLDSREDRERDRRHRVQDAVANGGYRHYKRPSVDDGGRRRSHPPPNVNGGEDYGRGGRTRTYATDYSYDSPPSPGSHEPRQRARPQYPPRGSPLSPNVPTRERNRDRERDRDRDRDSRYINTDPSRASPSDSPPLQPPRPRPTSDSYGRRHSSHDHYSPRESSDDPDYSRARSRSHDGRGPRDRLSPSDAQGGRSMRPNSTYIPLPTAAGSGVPMDAPSPFARGNLRHTVHSSGGSPYRINNRDNQDDPRMSTGVRYIPAERQRRAERG